MLAQWKFSDFENPCLLVIDAQEKYDTDRMTLPKVLPKMEALILACKSNGWDVYWTRYSRNSTQGGSLSRHYVPNGEKATFNIDSSKTEIVESLKPRRFGLTSKQVFRTGTTSPPSQTRSWSRSFFVTI